MKKLFICLVLLFCTLPVFAENEISFIYLNGSNTNTEKSKDDFIEGINKLHKQIIINFNKDYFIKEKIIGSDFEINKKPQAFYWGDLSRKEIEFIEEDFDFLKAISPKPANYVRKFIAMCLHDAIWVSKTENMYPIINKLHNRILKEYNKQNKVVLVGYSAGTFIVQQYMLMKMPIINLKEAILNADIKTEFKNYIKDKTLDDTCTDAIFKTKLVTYDIENSFFFEDDIISFKNKIDKMNEYTKNYCAPNNVLIGSINYASPYALFYSDIYNREYRTSELLGLSYKYIVENNLFWLTVNYSDDPLGFPASRNITIDEVNKTVSYKIKPNGGFVYDKSDTPSRRTFIMAHLAYFSTAKRYAKILTKAINEGYSYFYMTNQD